VPADWSPLPARHRNVEAGVGVYLLLRSGHTDLGRAVRR